MEDEEDGRQNKKEKRRRRISLSYIHNFLTKLGAKLGGFFFITKLGCIKPQINPSN